MTRLTWLAILVLGPGSLVVFVWFLRDVRRLFSSGRRGTRGPT